MGQHEVIWLVPDRLFDGGCLTTGLAIGLQAGSVVAVVPVAQVPEGIKARPVAGTICPGFLDLQVNGGGGYLLNNTPTLAAIAGVVAAHRRFGTVGLLATVITDRPDILRQAVEAVLLAKDMPGVMGLHIEGPHLSLARRGTHAADLVRPFEPETFAHVHRLRAAGLAVMITVAPESVTPEQIRALAGTGAVVSIGHSDATAEAARAALAAGARCFTHLFNAMSPMLNRSPGVTGAAINSDAYCGIICDGIHVADEMVGLAIRARPVPDRMFLVSDAMATVGGPDEMMLYGQRIRLINGRLENAEGSLAGAHVTMAQSVQRLIRVLGIAPDVALRMAVTTPAAVMAMPGWAAVLGRPATDLLVLGVDWQVAGTCAGLIAAQA